MKIFAIALALAAVTTAGPLSAQSRVGNSNVLVQNVVNLQGSRIFVRRVRDANGRLIEQRVRRNPNGRLVVLSSRFVAVPRVNVRDRDDDRRRDDDHTGRDRGHDDHGGPGRH
jgi:hypothetical protein